MSHRGGGRGVSYGWEKGCFIGVGERVVHRGGRKGCFIGVGEGVFHRGGGVDD